MKFDDIIKEIKPEILEEVEELQEASPIGTQPAQVDPNMLSALDTAKGQEIFDALAGAFRANNISVPQGTAENIINTIGAALQNRAANPQAAANPAQSQVPTSNTGTVPSAVPPTQQ